MAYSFIARYSRYPGFYGVVAVTQAGKPVAMGFGSNTFEGNWWFDRIAEETGLSHPALQHAWALVELSVLKRYRDAGIGTEIIHHLLQHQRQERILLSTQKDNFGARRLYERLGWTYVHDGLVFAPGQEPYVIMCKEMTGGIAREEK